MVARNNILSDNINTENATQEFNLWLENDGIRLTDFILEKRTIQQQLKEKDGENQLIIRDAARRRELNARNNISTPSVLKLVSPIGCSPDVTCERVPVQGYLIILQCITSVAFYETSSLSIRREKTFANEVRLSRD